MTSARKTVLDCYRQQRTVPFQWGVADCLLGLAAPCALALTGRDPAEHLRGRYDNEQSARRLMVKFGWRTMGDVAASMFAEIPVAQARAGDWVHVVGGDGCDGLGVVSGSTIVIRTKDGVSQLPLTSAARAFRVA